MPKVNQQEQILRKLAATYIRATQATRGSGRNVLLHERHCNGVTAGWLHALHNFTWSHRRQHIYSLVY